jgi:hypothetical protein
MERGPIREMHKVAKLARQPGGLKSATDLELNAYAVWLRDGADERGIDKKARRGFQERLRVAEAEIARRGTETAD